MRNRQKYKNILVLTYSDSLRALVCDSKLKEISGLNIILEEDNDSFFVRKLQLLRIFKILMNNKKSQNGLIMYAKCDSMEKMPCCLLVFYD